MHEKVADLNYPSSVRVGIELRPDNQLVGLLEMQLLGLVVSEFDADPLSGVNARQSVAVLVGHLQVIHARVDDQQRWTEDSGVSDAESWAAGGTGEQEGGEEEEFHSTAFRAARHIACGAVSPFIEILGCRSFRMTIQHTHTP